MEIPKLVSQSGSFKSTQRSFKVTKEDSLKFYRLNYSALEQRAPTAHITPLVAQTGK